MAASSGKLLAVGTRKATVFALNASGSPAATNTTAYEGATIVGAQAFDMNIPDPRKITHVGDDRALQVDFLPALEGVSGELRAARHDTDVYALLTGTTVETVGESKFIGVATSKQGSEPQVGLLMFQQALDETGTRSWRSIIVPKATIYPHPNGMGDAASAHRFIVNPAVVTKHLWETAFALATNGFTDAQALLGHHVYQPKIVSFLFSTTTTTATLPTAAPAADVAKMSVFVDGVAQTADITKTTASVTFTTAPGNNKRIVIFYETTTA